jgi:hypothetical protein
MICKDKLKYKKELIESILTQIKAVKRKVSIKSAIISNNKDSTNEIMSVSEF